MFLQLLSRRNRYYNATFLTDDLTVSVHEGNVGYCIGLIQLP